MAARKRAVVLLSGGLDSATVLALAKEQGYEVHALSVDYGQRHRVELTAAQQIARAAGVAQHRLVRIDNAVFAGSALTDNIDVPKSRSETEIADRIPETYVPARNTLFLAYALAWAETLGATDIFIGVNAVDYSGYPDCRPEFIAAFEELANRATKSAVEGKRLKIHTPLIHMSKAEIIRAGTRAGIDYSLTCSCYDPAPDGRPCGLCDACQLRQKGFREAGLIDPLPYPAQ